MALAVWRFVCLRAATSLARAIRLGFVLLVAGQSIGGTILREGLRHQDAGPVSSPVVFAHAGVMNVPHAVWLHWLQGS